MPTEVTASAASPQRGFTRGILAGFALTPLVGIGGARLLGLLSATDLHAALVSGLLPAFLCTWLLWTGVYFHRFLRPTLEWMGGNPGGGRAPEALHRRLARFSRDYWGLLLLCALSLPLMFPLATGRLLPLAELPRFIGLLALQLASAVFVGMPSYLQALDRLGRLVPRLGLQRVEMGLYSRLLLLVGLLPVLGYTLVSLLAWKSSGQFHLVQFALLLGLSALTLHITRLSRRSLRQSLRPVATLLGRSGATTHAELAALRPQSTDEIGYLAQTLARLFRRLGDQESHMRAVVDTAAEGIIVLDARGLIGTFNPAAERLFGYRAAEIRGRPLGWLLPELVDRNGLPPLTRDEQETTARHRNGSPLPVSVRVSEMRLSGRRMFTCLVADITQRKRAEDDLKQAEARYRDLVETAHDLVWSLDNQGHWTYVNGACQAIYGYAPEEMIGRDIREFTASSHAERDAQTFRGLLQGRELVQYETVHLDRWGKPHHISFNARARTDEDGRVLHISGTARDITDQKAFQERLTYQAEHDALTALYNRHYFQVELERTVARVARKGEPCALLYIDLDQFKYINDTLGHAAGDQLLVEISQLLGGYVREGDLLCRVGGDEFTILLYHIEAANVLVVAEHFRKRVEDFTFLFDGRNFKVTTSIGVALIDDQTESAEEALSQADLACNLAKAEGRNRIHLFDQGDHDRSGMAADMGWAARVREMLEQDRFRLVYQPIASVRDGLVRDYEVLVRMVCDDGEVILPGGFMPAAERFGLIHAVDRWIVEHAIQQLARLRSQDSEVRFSVNLSGRAFEDRGLLPFIKQLLADTGLDPSWLTFEITETAAIANLQAAKRFIHALKDIGCQFALDDFGSGFSSFAYLKHLPVDKLKIDGAFVQGMAQASVDQAMVQSMNQVAHALGKVTIAEYVESEEILDLLRSYGVDFAQGHYIGKPHESLITQPQASRLSAARPS